MEEDKDKSTIVINLTVNVTVNSEADKFLRELVEKLSNLPQVPGHYA